MAKPVSITLTQDPDGDFRVASFINTSQLFIGMPVDKARLDKWANMDGVTVRVSGLTPEAQQGELDLLEGTKAQSPKAKAKGMAMAS